MQKVLSAKGKSRHRNSRSLYASEKGANSPVVRWTWKSLVALILENRWVVSHSFVCWSGGLKRQDAQVRSRWRTDHMSEHVRMEEETAALVLYLILIPMVFSPTLSSFQWTTTLIVSRSHMLSRSTRIMFSHQMQSNGDKKRRLVDGSRLK